MAGKPTSIDDYLSRLDEGPRALLAELRRAIRSLVPDAEECISYSMPAFRRGKHVIAGFLATKDGASYYPFSGATLDTLAGELSGYGRTKSALHFDARQKLPRALIKKLLDVRIAETGAPANARQAAKPRATKPRAAAPAKTKRAPGPKTTSPKPRSKR
jgi:uncharacterized protein YdhG (YjbR/CyaY superfamily)